MAPACAACFGAIIFMLIKVTVHMRRNPVPWAVWTAPFFFLIAATVCTLSVVYKGSPRLGLNKKPAWYIAAVCLGTGFGVAILSAIFFVPYIHAKIIKRDPDVKWYHVFQGPLLFKRPVVGETEKSVVPNYAVVQHEEEEDDVEQQRGEKPTPQAGASRSADGSLSDEYETKEQYLSPNQLPTLGVSPAMTAVSTNRPTRSFSLRVMLDSTPSSGGERVLSVGPRDTSTRTRWVPERSTSSRT